MTIPVNGSNYTPPDALMYWIRERYQILTKKETGQPKPWSDNKVFQTTYFCNVHRENDRVTKWIRKFYSHRVQDGMFEYNIILSRFLNWPATLEQVGYQSKHDPDWLLEALNEIADTGKVWGNAYVITTHGIPMPKATYLCENVLEGVYKGLEGLREQCRGDSCTRASYALQGFEGLGSFLAAQVVADLKNTKGHPLESAHDKKTFVEHGPGSLRGVSWFHFGEPNKVGPTSFRSYFEQVRRYVDGHWPAEVPEVDNQDLQNCLCEFDKFMRVSNGTGRSKRSYPGGV